ncbi:hypothetical protein KR222_004438 [Zaprionus bogoriensis]|nr:hypothetical protein KR222_004438 [Zaprionus bogoriensis]
MFAYLHSTLIVICLACLLANLKSLCFAEKWLTQVTDCVEEKIKEAKLPEKPDKEDCYSYCLAKEVGILDSENRVVESYLEASGTKLSVIQACNKNTSHLLGKCKHIRQLFECLRKSESEKLNATRKESAYSERVRA